MTHNKKLGDIKKRVKDLRKAIGEKQFQERVKKKKLMDGWMEEEEEQEEEQEEEEVEEETLDSETPITSVKMTRTNDINNQNQEFRTSPPLSPYSSLFENVENVFLRPAPSQLQPINLLPSSSSQRQHQSDDTDDSDNPTSSTSDFTTPTPPTTWFPSSSNYASGPSMTSSATQSSTSRNEGYVVICLFVCLFVWLFGCLIV